MSKIRLSVTNEPLELNVSKEQAFWFLANMENESLWHPKVEKLESVGSKELGLGAKFVSQNREDGVVKLCLDEFVPCERLGNTIVVKGKPTERWSGLFSTNSEGQTLLTQTWEVLNDGPLEKKFLDERRKDILEYYKFLDPYLKAGVEKHAKK